MLSASLVCKPDKLFHLSGAELILMIKNLPVHGNMNIFYIQCDDPVFINILFYCKVWKK